MRQHWAWRRTPPVGRSARATMIVRRGRRRPHSSTSHRPRTSSFPSTSTRHTQRRGCRRSTSSGATRASRRVPMDTRRTSRRCTAEATRDRLRGSNTCSPPRTCITSRRACSSRTAAARQCSRVRVGAGPPRQLRLTRLMRPTLTARGWCTARGLRRMPEATAATWINIAESAETMEAEDIVMRGRANTTSRASHHPCCGVAATGYCSLLPLVLRRQSHKVFIGGLPQNATEGELLKYFEKTAGPVADVLILKVRAGLLD